MRTKTDIKSRKKLCIIVPSHWSAIMGGSQYQAKCLIETLLSLGEFDIYYLTRRYSPAFVPHGYRIIKIGDRRGLGRYVFFCDAFRLLNALHHIKPHVIYQRVGCSYTGIAAYYAKRNGCKMVWHIAHDRDVLPFQRRRSLADGHCYLEKRFLEYGVAQSEFVIAQTHEQGNYLLKHYNRRPTAVIYNFHPIPHEQINKQDPVKVVWVANFKPWKQPEQFIRLAKDLSGVDNEIQWSMIGAPPMPSSSWQRSLEARIRDVHSLSYLGARPIEVVNAMLSQCHIFVNTSLQEGFANTFIQAWMRKVPVVSLYCNPDHVFTHHSIGYCAGSYETLRQQVLELAHDPTLRAEMGERAREYAIREHSHSNLRRLISILKEA